MDGLRCAVADAVVDFGRRAAQRVRPARDSIGRVAEMKGVGEASDSGTKGKWLRFAKSLSRVVFAGGS